MLGLIVGSSAAGPIVRGWQNHFQKSGIWLYAFSEIMIAAGAFLVPILFHQGEQALLPTGTTDSIAYMFWSAAAISLSIFPWCFFMGTTYPFMMAFLKEREGDISKSFSFLYLANVIGAMAGVILTALVLIESLGFHRTLAVGASINFLIALVAIGLGLQYRFNKKNIAPSKAPRAALFSKTFLKGHSIWILSILFVTGFTSMAMEVAWVRAFTTVLKTQVYSFASLLLVYLLATWVGSLIYRRHLAIQKSASTYNLLICTFVASFLPLLLNDPRLHLNIPGALISIFPFCALLGYLTPKLIDEISEGDPSSAGISYAVNILGCTVGPLVASYFLLPFGGVKFTLVLLTVPFIFLLVQQFRSASISNKNAFITGLAIIALVLSTPYIKTYEDETQDFKGVGEVRRDHVATVISFGEGLKKRMLVNGIGITHLTTITKVMAHMPLSFLNSKPDSALMICFGMGTTFRSLMSWGIDVTAVELVPSVKEAFGFYHQGTEELLARPNGRVVIDDGRRYLKRNEKLYDVITLDPPPPPEAAGSSLLYSNGFYSLVKQRLKPTGILQQWVPEAEDKIYQAVAVSIKEAFPYVRVFKSVEGWGHHFLASMQPLPNLTAEEWVKRMPTAAQEDLMEWAKNEKDSLGQNLNITTFLKGVLKAEKNLDTVIGSSTQQITDDQPFNEYYFLRRISSWASGEKMYEE
jgi:spermidine synthase